jgi:hypothetical protein
MSTATVRNSSGTGFLITNSVLNSSGTAFSVDDYALNASGSSFLIFLSAVIPTLTQTLGGDSSERLKEEEKFLMMIIKAYMKHTL